VYFVPTASTSFVAGDITVELSEARVALGPAYFCASSSASATLCETAIGEIRDEAVIDALQADRQPIGTYRGFVGDVRTVSHDFGIHWFLPQEHAAVSAVAPNGHSALFRGTASRAGTTAAFEMRIDIVPQSRGQRAVSSAAAPGSVTEETEAIEVRLDVESWLSTVDYEQMLVAGQDPYVVESGEVDHDNVAIRMVSSAPVEFVFTSR
jgi:hypothetical protein